MQDVYPNVREGNSFRYKTVTNQLQSWNTKYSVSEAQLNLTNE